MRAIRTGFVDGHLTAKGIIVGVIVAFRFDLQEEAVPYLCVAARDERILAGLIALHSLSRYAERGARER